MKPLRIRSTDCSCEQLVRIAKKCGFGILEGSKHCKVITKSGQFITTIPRHHRLKRETARGVGEKFVEFGGEVIVL